MRQLTLISGKGGTGKTTLTASFMALSERAVLVDADVDASNLHLIMAPKVTAEEDVSGGAVAEIDPATCTQCGQCEITCQFHAIDEFEVSPLFCRGCAVCPLVCPVDAIEMKHRSVGRMRVCETRYGPLVYAEMEPAEAGTGKLITALRNRGYAFRTEDRDLLLVDGSPGIGCSMISSITGVDLVLAVTEPTLSGLHDLERALDVARHFAILSIVCINKFDINPQNVRTIERFCAERGVEVVGKIPFDPSVTEAMVHGKPVIEYRDSAAGTGNDAWTGTRPDSAWRHIAYVATQAQAGDPASPWQNEPPPNGGRINMGAYGNTAQASKTKSHSKGKLPLGLSASTVTERMDRVKTRLAATHARCEIGDVRLSAASVSCFEKLEVTFRLAASYANPYDPDDIRVDATITFPEGSAVTVPAFYSEPFRPDRGVAQMMLWVPCESAGTPCWKVRFAPPLPGEYSLSLVATQRDGRRATYGPLRFVATPSAHPGFVQVSRDNPRYFETSGDGRLFWGTGSNMAWTRDGDPGDPHPCYEYYFGKAAGHMNATRVWLCHWAWLEWTPAVDAPGTNWEGYGGIGIYNQMIADALDRVFLLAEKNGLRIMLVTEDNNELMQNGENDGWAANPYNQVYGGPCQAPEDVFSSPEARRHYRNRLRYIVARWGYSTSLWAINSWNDCSNPTPAILDWLREMRDLTHQLTEGYRPLIYGTNYRHGASALMDYAHAGADAPQDRPQVTQECYYTDRAEDFAELLRSELWTALASGHAAVMVWPHALVDNTDSWRVFEPVMRAAQSLPLNRGTWRSVRARVTRVESAERKPPVRLYTVRPYGDVPDWGAKATRNRFTIWRDESAQWLEGAGVKLYGDRNGRREWRNPPTFAVDFPTPARLLVEVDEIGSGDQTLCVSVDGRETVSAELRGGRRVLEGEERWVEAPFGAGPHEIRVENGRPGADWISIRRYCFVVETERVADLVDVRGLQSDTHGLVYLRNQTDSQLYREVFRQPPVLLTDVQLRMEGVAPGRYEVMRLDTRTTSAPESRTQESREGTLELDLGELRHDDAVRFRNLARVRKCQ